MSDSYPADHLERIAKAWEPPHHTTRDGSVAGTRFEESLIRQLIDASFMASLRAEEGKPQRHGLVLVSAPEQLEQLDPPWFVSRIHEPVKLDSQRIAKLAGVAADDDCFLVVAASAPPMIVGFGHARESRILGAEDRYPRVRAVGPGDLVFYRGDSAILRYRAGQVEELRPDFFVAQEEPRAALMEIGRTVFSDWPEDDRTPSGVVGAALSRLLESIAARGRGGMLAVLAPGEQRPDNLLATSSYRLAPIKLGDAVCSAYHLAMAIDQIEQGIMGADLRPMRGMTDEEAATEVASRHALDHERRVLAHVGAMAGIDGAVLMNC